MPQSLVVKWFSPLETRRWFANAYIVQYVVASKVDGMDICMISLSNVAPSLIAKDMATLTHIGKGATFARLFGNIKALPQDRPIAGENSCFSWFWIFVLCFLPSQIVSLTSYITTKISKSMLQLISNVIIVQVCNLILNI